MYWASPLCQGYGNKENIVPALEEKSRWDEKRKDEPSYRGLGGVGPVAGCVQMVINGKPFKWRNASWHQPVIYKKDKTIEENNLLIAFLMKNRRVHLIFLVLKICNFYSIGISQKIQETKNFLFDFFSLVKKIIKWMIQKARQVFSSAIKPTPTLLVWSEGWAPAAETTQAASWFACTEHLSNKGLKHLLFVSNAAFCCG